MRSSTRQESSWDPWASYYDLADRDRAPLIAFYRSLLRDNTQSVLELGCGTGWMATALAHELRARATAAIKVVGVDSSPEMLKLARQRDAQITWQLGDMRSPPMEGPFDLILCCHNTSQHLLTDADFSRMLESVRSLLADDGIFAFDLFQPDLAGLGKPKVNRLQRMITGEGGRQLEFRDDFSYDPQTRILTVVWKMLDGKQTEPITSVRYHMRQYFHEEIQRLLGEGGLVMLERYGEFDRSPLTSTSMRQIMVCGSTAKVARR